MRRRVENEDYITVGGSEDEYSISSSGSGQLVRSSGTESVSDTNNYSIIRYLFDRYEIDVIVDSHGRFIGISEVTIKRDFLSPRQRMAIRSHIDVEEYYKE